MLRWSRPAHVQPSAAGYRELPEALKSEWGHCGPRLPSGSRRQRPRRPSPRQRPWRILKGSGPAMSIARCCIFANTPGPVCCGSRCRPRHRDNPAGQTRSSPGLTEGFIAACDFQELNAARERFLNLKPARWFDLVAPWIQTGRDPWGDFSSGLPTDVLSSIQKGVMRTYYRGMRFWKSPFDPVIYSLLIERLRPQTIIEIGSLDGGSATWFADQMDCRGLTPKVVSIDKVELPRPRDPRIPLFQADAMKLAEQLAAFKWQGS